MSSSLICCDDELILFSSYPYPSKAITQLAWKPSGKEKISMKLAIASEDSSLRVYSLDSTAPAGFAASGS